MIRTFTLNSREFYEAVRRPADQPWIANGALSPEPRARDPEVIVERRAIVGQDGGNGSRHGVNP